MSNVPYGPLMAYRNKLQPIYSYPVFPHEYGIIGGHMGKDHNVLDIFCGDGKVRTELLMSMGLNINYVGMDNDPNLKVDFPLFKDIDAIEAEGFPMRHFNTLLALNAIEHNKTSDETYHMLVRLNPYIKNTIIIMTPNPKCFDYMFADPQHSSFYTHEFLYGLLMYLGFSKVEIWRGKGIYPIREGQYNQNPQANPHLKEMNEFQRRVCMAMGLDWYGNLLVVGKR